MDTIYPQDQGTSNGGGEDMSGGIKRGKDIVFGWEKLIPKAPPSIKPKGYSTNLEISNKINLSEAATSRTLKRLRDNNKIECMKIKDANGHIIWVYKD